jgi:hypothetical protein
VTATPGTVNYVEGQVSIDGRVLSPAQNGNTLLQPNQVLSTANGKAEVLLSPGVFVRVGSNSGLRMVSPGLVAPEVEVVRGEAMIEADWVPKDARINVLERGAQTSILKTGLYKFDSDNARVEVIDGKVQVTENDQTKKFGKGKEVTLTADARLKPVSFDRKAEDDLYQWSNVRDGYLAEANASTAQNFYVGDGYGPFWGTGWYWDPAFGFWSWLPGEGYFNSPFGYPFYSPGYVAFAPGFGYGTYGYRAGYVGRGFASRGLAQRGVARPGFAQSGLAQRGSAALAPRASGFAGGGFHGGVAGGGFHGGGSAGGGFHAGGGRR